MTLDYRQPGPPSVGRHDQIYTTLLAVHAFFLLFGAVTLVGIASMPNMGHAKLFLLVMAVCEALYCFAMALVVGIRIRAPLHRRWPTMAINIIQMVLFPAGTALAIYGFLKVDKLIPGE